MTTSSLIAVAGPSGSGKTTWISQHFQDQTCPLFYLCPGFSKVSVDLARIAYRFPWVQITPETEAQSMLSTLPDGARVYVELGFNLALGSPFLSCLPCHRVAVLPPSLQGSQWHDWADDVVPGNSVAMFDAAKLPKLWRSPLTGKIFDPPSLDEILIELTGGAYGRVHRVKGIFELSDGRAFHLDFVKGLPGIEYTELNLPRWLEGRPNRFSGIEVVGWNLEQETIAHTLMDGCLSDAAIRASHRQANAHYQEQYQAQSSGETNR